MRAKRLDRAQRRPYRRQTFQPPVLIVDGNVGAAAISQGLPRRGHVDDKDGVPGHAAHVLCSGVDLVVRNVLEDIDADEHIENPSRSQSQFRYRRLVASGLPDAGLAGEPEREITPPTAIVDQRIGPNGQDMRQDAGQAVQPGRAVRLPGRPRMNPFIFLDEGALHPRMIFRPRPPSNHASLWRIGIGISAIGSMEAGIWTDCRLGCRPHHAPESLK